MPPPLTIAAAQPPCAIGDVATNVATHTAAIREAGARVVVFPELSLTGYVLDAPAVDPTGNALTPLVEACAATNTVALVGAPIIEAGRRSIATLAVSGDGASVAYRKMHLGSDEARAFDPGPTPASIEVDGWRLGLAICKDTGVPTHANSTAALGIDAYLAGLVHSPDELAEQDRRGVDIATRLGVAVVFASAAGPTGPDYPVTAGHSTIWSSDATILARAGDAAGEIATTTLHLT